jgi:hypothetical protein
VGPRKSGAPSERGATSSQHKIRKISVHVKNVQPRSSSVVGVLMVRLGISKSRNSTPLGLCLFCSCRLAEPLALVESSSRMVHLFERIDDVETDFSYSHKLDKVIRLCSSCGCTPPLFNPEREKFDSLSSPGPNSPVLCSLL